MYIFKDGTRFSISDDCTYLIASDSCSPANVNTTFICCNVSFTFVMLLTKHLKQKGNIYQVLAVQEHRYNITQSVSYLGKVIVKYGSNVYEIDKQLRVSGILILNQIKYSSNKNVLVCQINGVATSIPFESTANGVSVKPAEYNMILFQTAYFSLRFDGVQFFQLTKCGSDTFCGLCGVQNSGQPMGHAQQTSDFMLNDPTKSYCSSSNLFPDVISNPSK